MGQIFDEYFSTQNVRVALTHGDITARDSINPSNIRATVGGIVRGFLKRSKLKAEDLAQIIQVADTDGAYIPDSSIIESTNLQRFRYTLSTIEGADKSQIVKRNERKQSNFIRNSSFSVCEDYQSSWDFIKQGNNSLCRYSNLGICFKN